MGFLDGRRNVKIQADDGSHKLAKMVEGAGVYVCHKHEYATEDFDKWNIHLKTEDHIHDTDSKGKCIICNKKGLDLTGHPLSENPVCTECEERLIKSRQRVHTRLELSKKEKEKGK